MDGKHSMWEPWYLDVMMATMAPNKVQCKFCGLQFIDCKDMMFNHLGYHPSGGGKRGVGLCAEARPQMKALFARCGGNVPTTLDNAQASSSLLDIHVPNLVNNKVPLTTLLLRAPKQMVHNVFKRIGLAWMIPFICQTFPLDK